MYIPLEMPDKTYNISELLGMVSTDNLNETQIMQMFQTITAILQDMGFKQAELLEKGEDIFEIKPSVMGVSVNFREAWRRMVKG